MPSHHKRHSPSRPPNGQTASDVATPVDTVNPELAPPAPSPQDAPPPPSPQQPRRAGQGLNITDLKDMSIQKLTQIAKDLTVAGATECGAYDDLAWRLLNIRCGELLMAS